MSLLLLSQQDIKKCIDMSQAIEAMKEGFEALANHQTVLPLRTAVEITKEDALLLTMPAYIEEGDSLGLKVVSLFPKNVKRGITTINGVILLLDSLTGLPKVIMEASYLTSLRTGAVSGLATKYFAKDDAHHLSILGTGIQAETQVEAVAAVRDIHKLSIWSRSEDNAHLFAQKFDKRFDVQVFKEVHHAVADADIICTATGSNQPLVQLAHLKPDVHINAIGSHSKSMREIGDDVFSRALTIVDQKKAALAEAGEIISAINNHVITENDLHELGSLLLQDTNPYKNRLTVFKSVGLAIQDICIADKVYSQAVAKNMGSHFSLF